jgi:hypothetical protein
MEFHHYAEVDKGNARKVLEECGGRADLIK